MPFRLVGLFFRCNNPECLSQKLVFKRRPSRAAAAAACRYVTSLSFPSYAASAHPLSDIPIPPSASRWNVNSASAPPSPVPFARSVSRIAIQRREDRLAVPHNGRQSEREREKRVRVVLSIESER